MAPGVYLALESGGARALLHVRWQPTRPPWGPIGDGIRLCVGRWCGPGLALAMGCRTGCFESQVGPALTHPTDHHIWARILMHRNTRMPSPIVRHLTTPEPCARTCLIEGSHRVVCPGNTFRHVGDTFRHVSHRRWNQLG